MGLVINNSIAAAATNARIESLTLRQRARNELPQIGAVARRLSPRYAVVPLLPQEPIGLHRLLMLAGEHEVNGRQSV